MTGLRSQKNFSNRLDKYDKRIYLRKKKQLREPLNTDENVLLMAEQIKKKSVPGKFTNKLFKISILTKKRLYQTQKILIIKHLLAGRNKSNKDVIKRS